MRSLTFTLSVLVLIAGAANGQISAYGSLTYGIDENPLANYLKTPDHVRQAYLQVGYAVPSASALFDAMYVGGLTTFRSLEDRNSLEQSARLRYQHRSQQAVRTGKPATEDEEESETESEEEETPSFDADDPLATIVELSVKPSMRYDKAPFSDFDNSGVEGIGEYRFTLKKRNRMITQVMVTTRSYANVPLLSNWVIGSSARLHTAAGDAWRWGGGLSVSQKRYTNATVDTSQFQTNLSSSSGRGKGGKGSSGSSGSSGKKKVLLQSTSRSASQWMLSVFGEYNRLESILRAELGYRWNPQNTARRIAQDATGSLLTDDLYNDYFSYEGVEAEVSYATPLPAGVRGTLTVRVEQKNFGTPALDVLGGVLASQRKDLRTSTQFVLTRPVEVTPSVSVDINLTALLVRSESNDEYNDFSASGISVSIGVGF